jgi:curved DNA-binding protein CbpA
MKYFKNPQTLEELKKQYRELAMKHHPDKGGDTATMQAIKNEYDDLFVKLKDVRKDREGKTYTAKQSTNETPEHFKHIIDELMKMENITIEIIGCFIWVTGETKPYKDMLKALKFFYHSTKKAWYLKPENYHRQSRKDYSFDEIRNMYGTSGEVKTKSKIKLDEANA